MPDVPLVPRARARGLPVRPDLDQLRHQAKDLLRAIHAGDPQAVAELRDFHPDPIAPADAKLADAQLVLARSYQAPSWPRLVAACELAAAIWNDDRDAVREIVFKYPKSLHEPVLIRTDSNWGAPLSYAANLGRDRIITMLHDLGATDLEHAMGRAVLQSRVGTAALLHRLLGRGKPPREAYSGPGYTLSAAGIEFLLEIGAPLVDDDGRSLAHVDIVLETDSRKPEAKHHILELFASHGVLLPDTPTMALHRGRIDLLEEHLRRDLNLMRRRFSHEEIYPPELGCHEPLLVVQGTPLAGSTLLHMCVDYDELAIARWLLDHGADPNARGDADADGFGDNTPLFNAVMGQPNFWVNYGRRDDAAPFARLLLERGADPNMRASLRKQFGPGYDDDTIYECRNVSALGWGERFLSAPRAQLFVGREAMRLIAEAGGVS